MSHKVYIVTAGNYDDYQILEVFSSEELAENYLDRYRGGYGRIEVWEVDKKECLSLPKD